MTTTTVAATSASQSVDAHLSSQIVSFARAFWVATPAFLFWKALSA